MVLCHLCVHLPLAVISIDFELSQPQNQKKMPQSVGSQIVICVVSHDFRRFEGFSPLWNAIKMSKKCALV